MGKLGLLSEESPSFLLGKAIHESWSLNICFFWWRVVQVLALGVRIGLKPRSNHPIWLVEGLRDMTYAGCKVILAECSLQIGRGLINPGSIDHGVFSRLRSGGALAAGAGALPPEEPEREPRGAEGKTRHGEAGEVH